MNVLPKLGPHYQSFQGLEDIEDIEDEGAERM